MIGSAAAKLDVPEDEAKETDPEKKAREGWFCIRQYERRLERPGILQEAKVVPVYADLVNPQGYKMTLYFDKYPCPMQRKVITDKITSDTWKNEPEIACAFTKEEQDNFQMTVHRPVGSYWDGTGREDLPPYQRVKLRFPIGQRVICNHGSIMMPIPKRGMVVGFWYNNPDWKKRKPKHPYSVCYEECGNTTAIQFDKDVLIREDLGQDLEEIVQEAVNSRPGIPREVQERVEAQMREKCQNMIDKDPKAQHFMEAIEIMRPKLTMGVEPTEEDWQLANVELLGCTREQFLEAVKYSMNGVTEEVMTPLLNVNAFHPEIDEVD